MFKITILAACFLATISAYQIVQDEAGATYYLLPTEEQPLNRARRQTSVDVSKTGPGVNVGVAHQGNILDKNGHRLDGNAFASKNFRPSGPLTVGGGLDYSHIPSGSGVNLAAQNTRGFGTDLKATGTGNLWRNGNGNTRLDAVGQYGRHFGGFQGTGRPNYYGGLQFTHRF